MPSETPPGLLADAMLGRLARWLRLMGYDTIYDNQSDDLELARRARAEGRILLTRDVALSQRRGLQTLLVCSQSLDEQIEQVCRELAGLPRPVQPRCSLCNVPLLPATHEEVAGRVPPYVLRTQSRFTTCPQCGRVYWRGTHWDGIRHRLDT